jgi:hypothetical protein
MSPDKKVGDRGKKTQAKSQQRLVQCGADANGRKKNYYRGMEGALYRYKGAKVEVVIE